MILFYEITKSEFFHKPWMVIKRYGRNVNNSAVYSKFGDREDVIGNYLLFSIAFIGIISMQFGYI